MRIAIEGTQEKQRQKPKDAAKAVALEAKLASLNNNQNGGSPTRSPHVVLDMGSQQAGVVDPDVGAVGLVRRGNMRHHDNGRMT